MFIERVIGDAELSRRGSLAAGSSQVQITGSPKRARRDIYSDYRLSCHPRLQPIGDDERKPRSLSRILEGVPLGPPPPSSLPPHHRWNGEHNGSEKRDEPRVALSERARQESIQRSSSFCSTRIRGSDILPPSGPRLLHSLRSTDVRELCRSVSI